MSSITVLLADDRPIRRARLKAAISGADGLVLVGTAHDLTTAFSTAEDISPDLVVLSTALKRADEFEMLQALFDTLGTQVIDLETPANNWNRSPDIAAPATFESVIVERALACRPRRPVTTIASLERPHHLTFDPKRIILLGASTGGVEALMTILSCFPPNCPPTLIVQHTGGAFTSSLTSLLDRNCAAKVREGSEGALLSPGQIWIAPGHEHHMVLSSSSQPRIGFKKTAPKSGHRPSIDQLFQSATHHGKRVTAALLTGMGRDGAEGLAALRVAGAQTIAQNEASCVVFGMPRAAVELNGADQILDINEIGPTLLNTCAIAPSYMNGFA